MNTWLRMVEQLTLEAYKNDWKAIPIEECGDPLAEIFPAHCYPYYAKEMGLTHDYRVFARSFAVDRFELARSLLEMHFRSKYRLVAYDGWRSIAVQENLFYSILLKFTVPNFSGGKYQEQFKGAKAFGDIRSVFLGLSSEAQDELRAENCKYVSLPSKDPARPSPHATGGALDVWLWDAEENVPADMGVPFDHMSEEAGTFYHLRSNRKLFGSPEEDAKVCQRRESMIGSMINAGFTCYPHEFWHFNIGNQMDSLAAGGLPAQYGYIEPGWQES